MTVLIRPFSSDDSERWDAFCAQAHQATFLHSRKYLSYHEDRFRDVSLLIEDDQGRLLGLFPAAIHPSDETCIVSHPGITYGGILHDGPLKGERMIEALSAVAQHCAAHGAKRLIYKPVPSFYHRAPAEDDLYALFRLGARRTRCDLSSTIDVERRLPVSRRRRRSLAKARNAGVSIIAGREHLRALWEVVEENLARRHGAKPVHPFTEISLLCDRFPDEIACVCASLGNKVVAGVILYRTAMAWHAQYIACSEAGADIAALDAVFEHCIAACAAAGRRWFDFGTSTVNDGRELNESLYRFKSEFGGGGAVYESYELRLGDASPEHMDTGR